MCQPLPKGNCKWEDPNNYYWRNPPENRDCIIECDLELYIKC